MTFQRIIKRAGRCAGLWFFYWSTKNEIINGIPFKGVGKNSTVEFLFHVMHITNISSDLSNIYSDKAFGSSHTNIKCRVYRGLCKEMAINRLKLIFKMYQDTNTLICENIMNNNIIPSMANYYLFKDNYLVNLFCTIHYIVTSRDKMLNLLHNLQILNVAKTLISKAAKIFFSKILTCL